jgi:hypothetical protein
VDYQATLDSLLEQAKTDFEAQDLRLDMLGNHLATVKMDLEILEATKATAATEE